MFCQGWARSSLFVSWSISATQHGIARSNSGCLPFSMELGGSEAVSDSGKLEVVSGGVGADRSDDASVIVGFFGSADIGRSVFEVVEGISTSGMM